MKTILVTRNTDGIGRATARALAERGCAVIVHGRNAARASAVARDIADTTGNRQVTPVAADFAALADVRAMAQQILSTCPRLDVLINNAGIAVRRRGTSADGYESTFAINHLAPFLLTNLLLDRLLASAPARIVNVSSGVHGSGHIDSTTCRWNAATTAGRRIATPSSPTPCSPASWRAAWTLARSAPTSCTPA